MCTLFQVIQSTARGDEELANDLCSHLILEAEFDEASLEGMRRNLDRRVHTLLERRRRHKKRSPNFSAISASPHHDDLQRQVEKSDCNTPEDELFFHELLSRVEALPASAIQREYVKMLTGSHPTAKSKRDIFAEHPEVSQSTAYRDLAAVDEEIERLASDK